MKNKVKVTVSLLVFAAFFVAALSCASTESSVANATTKGATANPDGTIDMGSGKE